MKNLNPQYLNQLNHIKLVVFDFDGVFTDNTVMVNQEGVEAVQCWRSDGLGMARLRTIGVKILILSTETNPVVSVRAKKMNTECWQGIEDKGEAIVRVSREYGVELSEMAFVGNDINDIPALKRVGFPIAVADAYPEILPFVKLQTQTSGGRGAVREVCDLVYQIKSGAINENTLAAL